MERPHGLLEDLLNVEVNTIIKPSMTAEKMPPLPFALLDIIEGYGHMLQVECGIDLEPYLRPSRECCWRRVQDEHARKTAEPDYGTKPDDQYDKDRDYLDEAKRAIPESPRPPTKASSDAPGYPAFEGELSFDGLADLWPAFKSSNHETFYKGDEPPPPGAFGEVGKRFAMDRVHNGWDTFERLRIAASREQANVPKDHEVVVWRIMGSCSRLKYLLQGLQQCPPRPGLLERVSARDKPYATLAELVPRTRHQLQGTLRHKRIPKLLPSDAQSMIRKVWEVGIEEVMVQTSVQVDGDVVTRLSEQLFTARLAAQRETILETHRRSVEAGLSHWEALVNVALKFMGGVINSLTR